MTDLVDRLQDYRERFVFQGGSEFAVSLAKEIKRLQDAHQYDQTKIEIVRAENRELRAEKESLTAEMLEQARLLGMSGERETALLAKIELWKRAEADALAMKRGAEAACEFVAKERDRLREDAERYRWLKNNPLTFSDGRYLMWKPEELDITIDEARKGEG